MAEQDVTGGWEAAYADHAGPSLWCDDPIQILPAIVQEMRTRKITTVADLGCGDGRNLVALVREGFQCAGIDISSTALGRARDRLTTAGESAFLIRADASCLPLESGTVDALTCFDVFGQLPDPEKAVAEAKRVLAPGGLVAVNAFTPEDSEYGKGEQVGGRSFLYKGTLFRFFEETEVRALFGGWKILSLDKQAWTDPPHGSFRPYEHRHDNWILLATC